MAKRPIIKLVLVGESGTGKTSLIQRFTTGEYSHKYQSTIGADLFVKTVTIDDQIVTLQLWDTAGQERYQSISSTFYRGAGCCILVFALDDPNSFEALSKWHQIVLDQGSSESGTSCPIVVMGNKWDQPSEVNEEDIEKWCEEYGNIPFWQLSAAANTNVDSTFMNIAKIAFEFSKQSVDENNSNPDFVNLENDAKTKKNRCGC